MAEDRSDYDVDEKAEPHPDAQINVLSEEQTREMLLTLEAFVTRQCYDMHGMLRNPCPHRERGCLIDKKCPVGRYKFDPGDDA